MPGEENVFAYGTLMLPEIMRALLGRVPQGEAVQLTGYARHPILGEPYPGVIAAQDSVVYGILWRDIAATEIALLDAWEGPYYERRRIVVQPRSSASGPAIEAFAWVVPDERAAVLGEGEWAETDFRERLAGEWVESCAMFARARRG